jgi:hypothetical protein
MKRLLPCFAAALVLPLSSGCLFHRKASKEPKASPYVSSEFERQFEQRWVEKRTADLVAQGQSDQAARAQAAAEYQQKYSYAQPNK